jgi:hypothetical protein
MALQVNAPLPGGVTASSAYVRVQSARVFKKVGPDDTYHLMVDVDVFVSKDERDKNEAAEALACPAIDKFKFTYALNDDAGDSDLIAHAYAKLKTLDIFDGATDV